MKRFSWLIALSTLTIVGITAFGSQANANPVTPPPSGCPTFSVQNNFVDPSSERAEYVDGLLQLHYGASPAIGGEVSLQFTSYDEQCHVLGSGMVVPNAAFDAYYNSSKFSVRFEGPQAWRIWDDDRELEVICDPSGYHLVRCAWSVPAPPGKYISITMSQGNRSFTSTAYPIVEPQQAGNSSVVFIPGLEASRLYAKGDIYEDQLWEPNWQTDVTDLYLNENGESIKQGIYTRDIVDEVNSLPAPQGNIYKSFITMMNAMKKDNIIADWRPLPYDWRFDYETVVITDEMLAQVEQLANESHTKKVTIIAHSNGGLVAKALIKRLQEKGRADLVDKLILVAVPQSGTPKAMGALLHGDDVGFIKSIILPHYLTRGLGEHSQAAFNLLPTEAYFARVIDPVIEFDPSAPLTAKWRGLFGNSIDTAQEMRNFLKGTDGRSKPAAKDVEAPNVLLPSFINTSATRAQQQDSWTPPPNLKVVQIVGWGLDTLRGIKYTERTQKCTIMAKSFGCEKKEVIDHRPLMTTDGDETVISYSADKMGGETYYIDLFEYNKLLNPKINRDHSDILEVSDARNAISNLILNDPIIETNFLKTTKPVHEKNEHRLSVHSPVSIDVYDSKNNHTGLKQNPNGDLPFLEEQIPNSSYLEFGEGKYVTVPTDDNYTVVIKGTDVGTFTFEDESGTNGAYTGGPVFEDIPVNPNTVVTLTLSARGEISPLNLDIDGNGTIDATIPKDQTLSAASLLDILEYNLDQLNLPKKLAKKFDKKLELVKKSITKQKVANADKRLDALVKLIKKNYDKKILTLEQIENLMGIIEQIKIAIK